MAKPSPLSTPPAATGSPAASADASIAEDVAILDAYFPVVQAFADDLDGFIAEEQDYGGLVSRIKRRLEAFEEQLELWKTETDQLLAEEARSSPRPLDACFAAQLDPWHVKARRVAPCKVVLTGPKAEDRTEVETVDETEADYVMGPEFIGFLSEQCDTFRDVEQDLVQMHQRRAEVYERKLRLRNPPKHTVQTHIALLRQYNELKDIGQQLIGLNAENLGVPVGSMYREGQYGVKAHD